MRDEGKTMGEEREGSGVQTNWVLIFLIFFSVSFLGCRMGRRWGEEREGGWGADELVFFFFLYLFFSVSFVGCSRGKRWGEDGEEDGVWTNWVLIFDFFRFISGLQEEDGGGEREGWGADEPVFDFFFTFVC